MFLSQSFPLVQIHTQQWYLKVPVSRCVKVQRKFMKFRAIYQTLTASSGSMRLRIRIWNTFKTKKEVLKINLITLTAIGSPVSFLLLQADKVWFKNIYLLSKKKKTEICFHKEISCFLIRGDRWEPPLRKDFILSETIGTAVTVLCITVFTLHKSHNYSAVWHKDMTIRFFWAMSSGS